MHVESYNNHNRDDNICVRTTATLRAERMASAGFTLGSKKLADVQSEADDVGETTGQQDEEAPSSSLAVPEATPESNVASTTEQDEHMVYESLTDTSSDSDVR